MPDLTGKIKASVSTDQASVIDQSQQQAELSRLLQTDEGLSQPTYHFEQNNYSPEALSDIEIYRKTNNQLSIAKSALGIPQR
jgi:hypothetical protein